MISGIIFIITFVFFTSVLAKTEYLPPLGPINNVVSDEVMNFIDGSDKSSGVQVKNSKYDVLGRRKTQKSWPDNFVVMPKETMDVDIAFRQSNKESPKISGRYEIIRGEKKYWFNDKEVSEEEYFSLFDEAQNKEFSSHGYRARLTAEEIKELLNGDRKVFIEKARESHEDNHVDYNIIFTYSEITSHAHSNGYKGAYVGIYFDEPGRPSVSNMNTLYYRPVGHCNDESEKWHATGVATILQRTAPKAMIYNCCERNAEIPDSWSYYPNIMIGSHSWSYGYDSSYTAREYKYDGSVYNDRVVHFFAAGNQAILSGDFHVEPPASAPNVIAVGAVSPTNHRYKVYSRHVNPARGHQKPEVANYAEFIFPDVTVFTDNEGRTWNGWFDKTSAAAPYTAAMTADLLSQVSFLRWHPEIIKALFLSSEKIAIGNASSFDLDNGTVAKGMPSFSSLAWNHRFRYWDDDNECCFGENRRITFIESDISSGTHYRIAISWLTSPDYLLNHGTLSQDLDLFVYQNGQLLAHSLSGSDPFEVVDFTTQSDADLEIVIERYANSGDDKVILGYSFWNDF